MLEKAPIDVQVLNARNAVALIRRRVAETPDRDALVFVDDPEAPDGYEAWTYRRLDEQARRIAGRLQADGLSGERVLLLYPPGLDGPAAFVGCLYAGSIPVLAPLPGRYHHEQTRLRGIIRDAGIGLVLTDRARRDDVAAWLAGQDLGGLRCAATGDDDFACARAWSEPAPEPETVALLQYTSGSTMEPKGVMITHRNLLHNVATSRRSLGIRDDARFGGWGPLYHDMGLLGQVTPALFSGTTCVLMSPATFLKRPHLWLRMIDRFDIQVSSAPDFAYELCTRRITAEQLAGIDLSRWDIAINGSEPVRADVVEAFVEQCGPAGFRPATMTPSFGMAEATVFVTGTGEAEATLLTHRVDGAVKRFVGCGRPAAIEIRIVQPQTVIAVRDGVIGEILLSGQSVSPGYWRSPEATAATFGVRLPGENGRTFLRTGDLGFLRDGELFVTGRIKDLMVIRGRNIYPHDVEHALASGREEFEGLRGAAFTVTQDTGMVHRAEQLVVVHEVRGRHTDARLREITGGLRTQLADEFGLRAEAIVLVRPGAVRRTTSGKAQRSAMRALFLAGELRPVHVDADRKWLTSVRGGTSPVAHPDQLPGGNR